MIDISPVQVPPAGKEIEFVAEIAILAIGEHVQDERRKRQVRDYGKVAPEGKTLAGTRR
jgi:DNA topoisomerase IB